MNSAWKLTVIGIALTGGTALTTAATTAYLLRTSGGRPAAGGESVTGEPTGAPHRLLPPAATTRPRPAIYHPAPPPAVPARTTVTAPRATPPTGAPAPGAVVAAPEPISGPAAPPPGATAPAPPVVATSATGPADCATGADRAWRVAKPGLIGTVIGAGVGAAGGAIADGGNGAGKGALIGGLAGAAAGAGYGAYTTKQECGTIFGGTEGGPPAVPGTITARYPGQAPLQPRAPQAITVYGVR